MIMDSFNTRQQRKVDFKSMLRRLPHVERLMYEVFTLLERFPMQLCGVRRFRHATGRHLHRKQE